MLKRLSRLLSISAIRTLPSIEAYDRWAANYPPHAHNRFMDIEEAAMRQLLPGLQGKAVLDLACGTGRYGLIAAQGGARLVIGVDNSPAMLAANAQTRLALATTEAIPLPANVIDVILCGLALGHLRQIELAMREISRVLKPAGFALISDFHPIAALNGGQRTFRAEDGSSCAVEHYPHLYADYHRASRRAGLEIVDVAEARDDNRENTAPVVIVYALRKPVYPLS